MLRKVLFGVGALALSASLACAGEGGINVETRLDIGLFTSAVTTVDDDFINYGGIVMRPVVKGSYQFTEEWGAELAFNFTLGFDDDDGEFVEEDAEASYDGFGIGGLATYTFKVDDKLSVVPVAGFSWRSEDMEGDADDFDGDGTYEASYFTLDFGCRVKYAVNDQWSVSGELMLGVPLFGDSEIEIDVPGFMEADDEGDLDGGFLMSVGATAEFKLQDNIILLGGIAYERSTVGWEYDDSDEDGETELSMFYLRLGAVFKF